MTPRIPPPSIASTRKGAVTAPPYNCVGAAKRAVRKADATGVEPARQLLLHERDQLDERPQAAVVLRLAWQTRKPARRHTADQAEELPIRTDPHRRLANRQRDQLRISRNRRPPRPGMDSILISEDIRCNNKGFQIRHLELRSRGDTGLEALLREQAAGHCETRPTFTSTL
jgi:hypothetical protein